MKLLENMTQESWNPYFQSLQKDSLSSEMSINFLQHESIKRIRDLFTASEYCWEKLKLTTKETVLEDFEKDTLWKLMKIKLEKALMRRT